MSEAYSQQQPTMVWNTEMKYWETSEVDLLSGLSVPFSETWQTSGMMRNGQVFELPMQEPLTNDSESSSLPILGTTTATMSKRSEKFRRNTPTPTEFVELLRSPKASEGEGGALGEAEALKRGNTVGVRDQVMDLMAAQGHSVSRKDVLPTPTTMDAKASNTPDVIDKFIEEGRQTCLTYELWREPDINKNVLPTPTSSDWKGANNSGSGSTPAHGLSTKVDNLLKTPVASEGIKAPAQQSEETKKKTGQVWLSNQAKDIELSWGRFEPAIRRWEAVLGRLAPAPTKPDGKDGAHRLSSRFTEWMMGLPDGWITDVGLSRNEELKACGNGVVPQQAELALRVLLNGVQIEAGGGQVNLPTPTVSDIYTDNLKSSQQKPGSMHSVTLPQAVHLIPRKD